jgi:hypothetical protein
MPKRALFLGTASAFAALALSAASARADDSAAKLWSKLQPARAVYLLRQPSASADEGSLITGRMTIEGRLSCDELSTTLTIDLRATSGAQTMTVAVAQHSTESRDGRIYRFSAQTTENGAVVEHREGQAVLESREGPGDATIKGARAEDFKLAAGTILPGTHMLRVLATAAAGKRQLEDRVFYGLDRMRIADVKVMISGLGKSSKSAALGAYSEKPGWTIREEQKEFGAPHAPTQVSESFVTEDGVATRITLSMQGLELVGMPLSIEKFPKPTCKE